MNTTKLLLAATIVAMTAAGCGNKTKTETETPNILVLYYSQTGNTKAVAEEFATRLGADIEAIEAVEPYDGDFQATIERCMKERESNVLPDIKPLKSDLSKYDIIFLGYPIWFGTFAPPVKTFLTNEGLGGKIVPFCTFGSGGLESSLVDLHMLQPLVEVVGAYGVRAARMDAMPAEVDWFLKANGFIEGEYTEPKPWGEEHEVSADEAAVFDAATGDYPMLHAKAKTVMVRENTMPGVGGTDYLFTAEDLPREDKPNMPPAGEMKVYVTVAPGQAPVFTSVVR